MVALMIILVMSIRLIDNVIAIVCANSYTKVLFELFYVFVSGKPAKNR